MNGYPRAAVERMMKIQEVILRAMAKKVTWWQAAEIIGITDRCGAGIGGTKSLAMTDCWNPAHTAGFPLTHSHDGGLSTSNRTYRVL